MTNPDFTTQKQLLRKSMRQQLRKAGTQDPSVVYATLERWLFQNPQCQTIAAFSALSGEPDLLPLIACHAERRWVFPKVSGHHLTFHLVENPEGELFHGAFQILEPVETHEEIPVEQIDAFFCPGLAFDMKGGRLGRGRGFYDRVLEMARSDAKKVGVCFPCQIVADTFAERHDIHMDVVVCGGKSGEETTDFTD